MNKPSYEKCLAAPFMKRDTYLQNLQKNTKGAVVKFLAIFVSLVKLALVPFQWNWCPFDMDVNMVIRNKGAESSCWIPVLPLCEKSIFGNRTTTRSWADASMLKVTTTNLGAVVMRTGTTGKINELMNKQMYQKQNNTIGKSHISLTRKHENSCLSSYVVYLTGANSGEVYRFVWVTKERNICHVDIKLKLVLQTLNPVVRTERVHKLMTASLLSQVFVLTSLTSEEFCSAVTNICTCEQKCSFLWAIAILQKPAHFSWAWRSTGHVAHQSEALSIKSLVWIQHTPGVKEPSLHWTQTRENSFSCFIMFSLFCRIHEYDIDVSERLPQVIVLSCQGHVSNLLTWLQNPAPTVNCQMQVWLSFISPILVISLFGKSKVLRNNKPQSWWFGVFHGNLFQFLRCGTMVWWNTTKVRHSAVCHVCLIHPITSTTFGRAEGSKRGLHRYCIDVWLVSFVYLFWKKMCACFWEGQMFGNKFGISGRCSKIDFCQSFFVSFMGNWEQI